MPQTEPIPSIKEKIEENIAQIGKISGKEFNSPMQIYENVSTRTAKAFVQLLIMPIKLASTSFQKILFYVELFLRKLQPLFTNTSYT